ncbi:MAG TPA: SMI1/KNR4 family protein [Verrucomicrobiae bacterium]|nr:SMI1/KNR4 family protein [Verrucomicrobiae bacterium]
MDESKWKAFLDEYCRELVQYEEVLDQVPSKVIKSGWLGFPGASENKIAKAEARLGIILPSSYRSFLRVSNGWRWPSCFVTDLLPIEKVVWFREQNQGWIDAFTGPARGLPPITDDEYFVYGEKQDCCKFRAEYLEDCLQISSVGDSAVVLLNPKAVSADGEWETWFFATWLPGANRCRSLEEWLQAARRLCSQKLTKAAATGATKTRSAKQPASVKKAQAVARKGETDLAVNALEKFAAQGEDAATASLAELYAFLGQWQKVIPNVGRLISNPGAVYAGNVLDDMIQLLGQAGHRTGDWLGVTRVVETAIEANNGRSYDQHHKWAQDRNDRLFRNLIGYADRGGRPPHELIAIFGRRSRIADMTKEELVSRYRQGVDAVDSLRPDLSGKPSAKAEHFFSLAKNYNLEDEALGLYQNHGATFGLAWDAAEYVAKIHAKRGNLDAAWSTIEPNIRWWWPADHAQVAPVVLLVDEHLCRVMTPERLRLVLSTPRGPEGVKK